MSLKKINSAATIAVELAKAKRPNSKCIECAKSMSVGTCKTAFDCPHCAFNKEFVFGFRLLKLGNHRLMVPQEICAYRNKSANDEEEAYLAKPVGLCMSARGKTAYGAINNMLTALYGWNEELDA